VHLHEPGDELGGRRVLASIDAPREEEEPIGPTGRAPIGWEKHVPSAAANPDRRWRYA
jgi:hypothetical protein